MRGTVFMGPLGLPLKYRYVYQSPSTPITTAADGVASSEAMMFRNNRTQSLLSSFHLTQLKSMGIGFPDYTRCRVSQTRL